MAFDKSQIGQFDIARDRWDGDRRGEVVAHSAARSPRSHGIAAIAPDRIIGGWSGLGDLKPVPPGKGYGVSKMTALDACY